MEGVTGEVAVAMVNVTMFSEAIIIFITIVMPFFLLALNSLMSTR